MIPADPHVVGLDLSLTGAGIASSRGWAETIGSTGTADATYQQRAARLAKLDDAIRRLTEGPVDLVVVEGPAYGVNNGHAWDRAGLWWATMLRAHWEDVPFAVVPPANRAAYATGHPRADKKTVLRMMRAALPAWELDNDNEADAAVLAAMGRDWLTRPLYKVDRVRWEALDGCAWPTDDPADLFDRVGT